MTTDSSIKKRGGVTSFAKSDPAISLASLFRPITRGRRPRGLTISAPWGADLILHFKLHTGLDTKDQSVFLTLVALAAIKGGQIDKMTTTPVGRQLWLDLNGDDGDAEYSGPAVAFSTSFYEILKEMGLMASATSYKSLLDSLDRLDGVSFKGETPRFIFPSQRLISYQVDKEKQRIAVVLNSRICAALTGQYVRIELHERAQLTSDAGKVLHAWLCAWCGPGSSKRIGVDKLVLKVWGMEAATSSTGRTRRKRIREALVAINSLPGWSASEDSGGVVHVQRASVLDAK
ncbi:putative Plasmid and phage iteron-binding protein [Roseovarius sp. EC-HK134]|uniref:replication protein C, IncQ-type n=1 Tax=unclassified Roseovarius TaxID=2614913 RepID=UPI0012547FB2|nr:MULTISPECIES: replication protein C, IncQ-type [unclassified Roseovarius]VVS96254.1 putative Plasmid and phage iteron-binding protein [Roseovarius sp. EC-SD190]VVS96283.1 putative Plasmid and phage iteron-binding protein [Roseovarius sp. EC-HK134]